MFIVCLRKRWLTLWGSVSTDLSNVELCVQIWVSSVHSASGYFTVYGDETSAEDHFNAHLATGDTLTQYCRTGYVGFVRRTEMTQSDGGDLLDLFVTPLYYCHYFYFSFSWP